MAMAREKADLPLPTSPPRTTRSPRRTPPPRILSRLGNPVAIVSGDSAPSATASARTRTCEIGEMSLLRAMRQDTARFARSARTDFLILQQLAPIGRAPNVHPDRAEDRKSVV